MKTIAPQRLFSLALLLLPACTVGEDASTEDTPRGALLFDLTEEELVDLHDRYLPDEDLELTRARLTAPFDCSLFDDLCAQVGEEAAIEITARQVDLALDGVSPDEMEAELDVWLDEASEQASDDADELAFRGSGPWATRTKGSFRLRVRNGITTPVIGMRRAWTESKLQHENGLGIWSGISGVVCSNTGNNTQVQDVTGGGVPPSTTLLESIDPAKVCVAGSSYKQQTYHARNSGYSGWGFTSSYTLTARGCGSGDVNGVHLGICASARAEVF